MMGYEATICQVCARTLDDNGIHEADEQSIKTMLSKAKIPYPTADADELQITPCLSVSTSNILFAINYYKRDCICNNLANGLRYVGYSRDNLADIIRLIEGKEITIIP